MKNHSTSLNIMCVLRKSRLKTCGFPLFIRFLFYLRSLPLDVCLYAFGQRTKISALNPFAPRFCLIKNSPNLYISPNYFAFRFEFIEFLMRQLLFVFCAAFAARCIFCTVYGGRAPFLARKTDRYYTPIDCYILIIFVTLTVISSVGVTFFLAPSRINSAYSATVRFGGCERSSRSQGASSLFCDMPSESIII